MNPNEVTKTSLDVPRYPDVFWGEGKKLESNQSASNISVAHTCANSKQPNHVKISVLDITPDSTSIWCNLDQVTHQDLADLWGNGVHVSPSLTTIRSGAVTKFKFKQADVLMVSISLNRLPLDVAMHASFTRQYATVAAYSTGGRLGGTLLLGFELPEPENNAKNFTLLLAGIETMYAGAIRHSSAEQSYGLSVSGIAIVLGGKLDTAAVRNLKKLGLETKELGGGRGAYMRSHVTVDRSTAITLPNEGTFELDYLHNDMEVFCPIHVDSKPTGIVHWFLDGTPGIQCSHCKRTFAAPTTNRSYDFAFFDRTIKTLAVELQQQVQVLSGLEYRDSSITYLAEPYLPPIPLESGITFVKSPKGSGKTEALVNLVSECRKKHLRVLLLGHRRALLQSISARLQIDCYFIVDDALSALSSPKHRAAALLDFSCPDEGDLLPDPIQLSDGRKDQGGYQRVKPTKQYAICLDSILELDPQDKDCRYDVVIIDESEQVFAHLTGETLKAQRHQVFVTLSYYLRAAKSVYLLDADLNMVTMSAAFEIFKPEMIARLIINEPIKEQDKVNMYTNRGQLVKLLIDRVGAGEKVFVTTNSKRKAVELSQLLLKNHPSTRLVVVTADNSQRKEVQDLLGNITSRFENDLDVLIASPAIGTGIDITFKDADGNPRKVVDSVFGFFEANIITHFDIDQQLMRVRHPGGVHVWVDVTPLNYETDVGCIKRELEKSVRKANYLLRYEDDGTPVFSGNDGLINIWARVLAASRGSKNKLANLFRALRVEGGWNLIDVEYDDDAAALGKTAMTEAKEARLAERMENLLEAEKLAHDDAAKLEERDKKGSPLNDNERHALERYKIEKFYADDDITERLIDFDNEGRTRDSVLRLECLLSNRAWLETADVNDLNNGVLAFDRHRYLVQREVLEAVFVASGLFDLTSRKFNTSVCVDAEILKPFLIVIESKRRQIESLFGMPIYEDCWRKPVVQLKGILGLVGLDLENTKTEQKGSKKIRRYGIPSEMLDAMVKVVRKRDGKYKRDMAVSPKREDKLSRVSANKIVLGLDVLKEKHLKIH